MLRLTVCSALAVLVAAAVSAPAVTTPAAGTRGRTMQPPGSHAGPPYRFTTELMGQFPLIPLKDQAMLTRTEHGYLFRTGQQDSHLVVTLVDGRLRFVDTGTKRFKKLSPHCHRKRVRVGVAAKCGVPADVTVRRPLLIEVWPRLGNDYTDTSSLPATFAVTVLSDEGHDVAHLGAGPDFFNGHLGRDVVFGGAGNDWIRPGHGNDLVHAGPGNDDIVAMPGKDTLHGGPGRDQLWGGDGSDRIWGDGGADYALCGPGRDRTNADGNDRVAQSCESVD